MCLAALLLCAAPCAAAGAEEALELQREALGLDGLEHAAREELGGTDIRLDAGWEDNLDALLDAGAAQLGGVVRGAARSAMLLLVIVLFCSLGEGLGLAGGESAASVPPLAGTLAVTAVAVGDVSSLLGLGRSAIDSMCAFANVLLPIVAAASAATGAVTGAAARQMAAAFFSTVLLNVIDRLLVPLLYGYIAASAAFAAVGVEGLRRLGGLFKWAVVTVLTALLLGYVSYLTMGGVIAGSADAAAVKAARFAISGAVPVVGGILSNASESVLAAAGVLRGSVGVFGMLVILSVCLLPFLRLAVHYLLYKLCAALATAVDGGRVSGLIDSLGTAFGLILGMTGACALLLLVSLVTSVSVAAV